MDPDRACDMIMNVAASMDNPGILRALRKPQGPEPGKFADVEQSRVRTEQGWQSRPKQSRVQAAASQCRAGDWWGRRCPEWAGQVS